MSAFKLPDPPLIAAGGIGGPWVIYLVTPLRNALTLGSMDTTATALSIYKQAFGSKPFAGGRYVAIAACPAFLVIGPMYHVYYDLVGQSSTAAVLLTGATETAVLYGAETRNAQIAFNNASETKVARLQKPYVPIGPGIGWHVFRNCLAMSGLRVLSGPCQTAMESAAPSMSQGARAFTALFVANCLVSAISTPFHQLYQFSVTQRLVLSQEESVMKAAVAYLRKQYLTDAGTISRVAARDVLLRVNYTATIYTLFGAIERAFVAYWPR